MTGPTHWALLISILNEGSLFHEVRRVKEGKDILFFGYGRGGFSSEIHLVTDGNGLPVGAVISGGQRHESAFFPDVMNEVWVSRTTGRQETRPEVVAGDKGYDAAWIRQ